ncbi:MAG: type II toxin-antitoxin system RelE/ParE family toxin [Candidatus Paracaedibacteraceae bacterium]|nr:type II toxin-antitoxin system RelE/ParE family toxin [Candidatus Paracaedibacteraceae bacterium]
MTKVYQKGVSRLLSLEEQQELENSVAEDPLFWPVIRGTSGVRKARFAIGNKGKRGGGRVCYLYLQLHEVVYMLLAYTKNEQEDLTEREKKQIKQLVEFIKETEGV